MNLRSSVRFLLDSLLLLWRNRKSRAGLLITVGFLIFVGLGPLILKSPTLNPAKLYQAPSLSHPLGTNWLGQDIFAQLAYGGGFIFILSFVSAVISIGVGTITGLTAAYSGGKLGEALTSLTDIVLAIPSIILVIVLAVYIKTANPIILGLMLSVVGWGLFARIIRSQILVLRNQPFIESAKILGLSRFHIIFVELLPNVMPYIAVNFIFSFEAAIFASVGLYYLGVLPYSTVNWGTMINQAFAQGSYLGYPGIFSLISPILAVTLFTVGLILLSHGLEEIFNPRIRVK